MGCIGSGKIKHAVDAGKIRRRNCLDKHRSFRCPVAFPEGAAGCAGGAEVQAAAHHRQTSGD